MSLPDVSERQAIAERFAAFIRDHGLANPYGGDVGGGGRYYTVGLAVPRYLDGEIRVYGPHFIQVLLTGALVGGERRSVFTSEAEAFEFLRLALVEHDLDGAEAVPTKTRAV
jgi:hypothetical protein